MMNQIQFVSSIEDGSNNILSISQPMKTTYFFVAFASLCLTSSCKRDFTCECEISIHDCSGNIIDYNENIVVKAITKGEAFDKCHDMDINEIGDCQTTDYYSKFVWCSSL